jgi:hypothetical protein
MADTKTKNKTYGLILSLAHAAKVFHTVLHPDGLNAIQGVFHPDHATPVGAPGELSLEDAKALDANPNIPLDLIEIAAGDVVELRGLVKREINALRAGAYEAKKYADGEGELDFVRDALNAAKA